MRLILLLLLATFLAPAQTPVIFDTDMGNDIDDALALAIIHSLESRGEAKLLAVTLTKDSPSAAPFCDIINTFYGRGSIPIGRVQNGKTTKDTPMIAGPVSSGLYPRTQQHYPEAVALLERVLRSQADNSVVIIQVGFSTNLSRLLAQSPDLVRRKVRLLSTMAGAFTPVNGKPRFAEYNIKEDLAAAKHLFSSWPTPIVVSGFEVGNALLYPATSIENDFRWVPNHPVADSYRRYMKMPYNRPTWDLTSVLYAIRPNYDYFALSPAGRVAVEDDAHTTFTPGAGNHRYLVLSPGSHLRIIEALTLLASQPFATPSPLRP